MPLTWPCESLVFGPNSQVLVQVVLVPGLWSQVLGLGLGLEIG